MTIEQYLLIKKFASREIDIESFFGSFLGGRPPEKRFLSELIDAGLAKKDFEIIAVFVLLLERHDYYVSDFVAELCKLLGYNWHYSHEDIVSLLKKTKNTLVVNCLFECAQKEFDYLEYDDTFQLARKCIKGLSAFGSQEAVEKLKLLALSGNQVVSGYAKKELGRLIGD